MEVIVFANLKNYFPSRFVVEQDVNDVCSLQQWLEKQNPAAASLLQSCRFAVGNDIVSSGHSLQAADIVAILPPGSGG